MIARTPHESACPDQPSTLGERLRWLRKQRGLTQVDFASAIGCDQAMVSSWEVGRTAPSATALHAIARYHDVPQETLLGGEDFLPIAVQAIEAFRARLQATNTGSGPIQVTLDRPPAGKISVVDLGSDRRSTSDLAQAQMDLIQAFRKGRTVWVVIR